MKLDTYTEDFVGAKVALLWQDTVLTILRDNKTTIPFPNMWDLPGGGREGQETAWECLAREVLEEVNLVLDLQQIVYWKSYPSVKDANRRSFFMVAMIEKPERLQLGNEGQCVRWMKIEAFIGHEQAVPYLRTRLQEYMNDQLEEGRNNHG